MSVQKKCLIVWMKQNLHTQSTTTRNVNDCPNLKYDAISAPFLQCMTSLSDYVRFVCTVQNILKEAYRRKGFTFHDYST
jgi:hypothetical protein